MASAPPCGSAPTGAPIAICSSAAIIYLGLDREVRGQLLEDRPNQQGCLVQFFQDAFLIPYVAIVELNEQRCPHYPRLSKEDITIDFLPQPSSDSLSLLQYVHPPVGMITLFPLWKFFLLGKINCMFFPQFLFTFILHMLFHMLQQSAVEHLYFPALASRCGWEG